MIKIKTIAIIATSFIILFGVYQPSAFADESTFKSAVSLFKNKKYNEAITKFKAVLKQNPGDYRAYYFAGRSYQKLGNKRQAIQYLSKAMICGYKTKVYTKASLYLERLDRTIYLRTVGISQRRYEKRKAQQAAAKNKNTSSKTK